jgi:hypothetical protein
MHTPLSDRIIHIIVNSRKSQEAQVTLIPMNIKNILKYMGFLGVL